MNKQSIINLLRSFRAAVARILLKSAVLIDPSTVPAQTGPAIDRLREIISPGSIVRDEANEEYRKLLQTASTYSASCLTSSTSMEETAAGFAKTCRLTSAGHRGIQARLILLDMEAAVEWLVDSQASEICLSVDGPTVTRTSYEERTEGEKARLVELSNAFLSVMLEDDFNSEKMNSVMWFLQSGTASEKAASMTAAAERFVNPHRQLYS